MSDTLKEWKLLQGALGLFAACGLLTYIAVGKFDLREWIPLLPAPPPPDTLIFHIDTMRRHFATQRYHDALRESEYVLARDKEYTEAIRVRAACLLRVGRFADAEKALRTHIGKSKYDLGARIDLAVALRGQNKNDLAQGVLLRLMDHPLVSPEQKQMAQSLLLAMEDQKQKNLFPDQPSLSLPSPEPSVAPLATPTPGLAALTIRPPGSTSPSVIPPFPWLPSPSPEPKATPLTEIPALVLPGLPTPQPEALATPEPVETKALPEPSLAPPPAIPRKILLTTLPRQKKAVKPTHKKKKVRERVETPPKRRHGPL